MNELKRSVQTVTPDGRRIAPVIDGVRVRQTITHQDERGSLAEIYSQAWGFDDVPLVEAYLVTVRPGKIKGWAWHEDQVDRYFFATGALKLVLYDDREGSATRGMINELFFGAVNPSLVSVPPQVYHAVENVGLTDGLMFNLPSHPYSHAAPDKYTLPLENTVIPYSFKPARGY